MSYQSQREKINSFFMESIFPKMTAYEGIDYSQTISKIAVEMGTSESLVEDVLRSIIKTGKIRECRFFELTESEIEERKKLKEKQINEELNEVLINGKEY